MKRKLGWIALTGFVLAGLTLYLVPLFFPLPERIISDPPQGLLFVDRNGEPVRRLLDGDLRAADPARYEEFSPVLIDATLAAEDSRFFSHIGFDPLRMGRAVWDALTERRFVSGASTVTQQTVKLYSRPRPRSFRTKFIELFTARKLEMFADKETILTAYLNRLPYGNQYTGARAAAQGYFGKPLRDLSAAEASLLAGLPNKPSRLNPWRNLDGARQRQMWILGRMKEEKHLTEAQYASALLEPLKLLPGPATTFHAPHLINLIQEQEKESIAKAAESGRSVPTTVDLELQQFVESTVSANLARLGHQSKEDNDLQAAVVVIENISGEVLALTGSRSFFGSESGQVNGAWSARSAGSTLKPFTYLLALERGSTAASILPDTPIEYVTSTGTYQPVNFDRQFHGPVSVRKALSNSLNVPAVKLLDQIGGPEILHETLKDRLRFTSLAGEATEYGLGLTLGNAEVRLLELTNGYACLARLGEWMPYQLTGREVDPSGGGSPRAQETDPQQDRIDDTTLFRHRIFDADAAWLLADILSDERARAEAFGLHSPLNLPFRCASKTGTSTDFRDNWTIGFTPDFTVGVWVGRFNNRPLNQVSGAIGAAPIFRDVMVRLHREREPEWYLTPDNAVKLVVDSLNGKQPPPSLSLPFHRTRQEWFVNQALPETASLSDYTEKGQTLLPTNYSTWWRSDANDLEAVASLTPISKETTPPPFRIVSPLEGTVAFLDPDLPGRGSRFPLEVAGSGQEEIEWTSPSLQIEEDGRLRWLVLEPGKHEVIARDRRTGRQVRSHVTVQDL
ncbi:MAG: penicillin-binding protein 1C [Verrucomicrobiales bacterium]|nr:penicillin-binding protein 1C [Verrucomicrobiales bacterium]